MLLWCVQLLIRSGRTPEESLMILVPEAYKNHPTLMIKYPEVLLCVCLFSLYGCLHLASASLIFFPTVGCRLLWLLQGADGALGWTCFGIVQV